MAAAGRLTVERRRGHVPATGDRQVRGPLRHTAGSRRAGGPADGAAGHVRAGLRGRPGQLRRDRTRLQAPRTRHSCSPMTEPVELDMVKMLGDQRRADEDAELMARSRRRRAAAASTLQVVLGPAAVPRRGAARRAGRVADALRALPRSATHGGTRALPDLVDADRLTGPRPALRGDHRPAQALGALPDVLRGGRQARAREARWSAEAALSGGRAAAGGDRAPTTCR